jgi:hypothetical protein
VSVALASVNPLLPAFVSRCNYGELRSDGDEKTLEDDLLQAFRVTFVDHVGNLVARLNPIQGMQGLVSGLRVLLRLGASGIVTGSHVSRGGVKS